MSAKWFKFGVVVIKIKHVEWRKGVAYYRRRVPRSVQKAFGNSGLFFSLKTSDPKEAARRAQAETNRLDREWSILRSKDYKAAATQTQALGILRKHDLKPGQWHEYDSLGLEPDNFMGELLAQSADEERPAEGIMKERLPADLRLAADLFYADPREAFQLMVPTFSEVVEKHLYFFPKRADDPQFHRSVSRFLDLNGDLVIDQYRRDHGNGFVRDMLLSGLKSETMRRYLNQIRPVFETARVELEISMPNPLARLKIPLDNDDPDNDRGSFTVEQIRAIQKRCREINDQRRWCIAILSDTGARLSEIAGLKKEDVRIEGQYPHLSITRNDVRGLKPGGSERLIPLVGEALWAAQQAFKDNSTAYLFPDFVKGGKINSNSLSGTLNKWLVEQGLRKENQPLHSLRHAIRDRLRNSGCPPDAADRIGGWKRQGVGEGYGQGHSIYVLHSYMLKMLEVEKQSEQGTWTNLKAEYVLGPRS